jgi:hypothetical protein
LPLKARDVAGALTLKGFKKSDRDHHFYYLWYKGKKTAIRTKISHGESEIHDKNCASMARQIKLNSAQFRDFVECPLTEQLYLKILVDSKCLEAPPSG